MVNFFGILISDVPLAFVDNNVLWLHDADFNGCKAAML